MGFGCNAAGIIGCRIIDSPREKLISIITNAFVPCNGRFPFLITISTIFIGSFFAEGSSFLATLCVLAIILLGIFMTLLASQFLSKTFLKGTPSSFVLELPPYRKPQFGKVLVRSILDRTLFVLARALTVAVPAGIFIWLLANLTIVDQSLLTYVANFFDPFAQLLGLDGYIFTAFLLGMPANEIALKLIEYSEVPIATPSANISGRTSGTNIDDIMKDFDGKVDWCIDDGPSKIGLASTIVQVVNGIPNILRQGAITEEQIKYVCSKYKI